MDDPSEATAIALYSLSERQRYCLRQVGMGRRSKQIARQLQLSSVTIDKDLERAARTLGCGDRFSAAELLRAHEGQGYEPFVYEASRLATAHVSEPGGAASPSQVPLGDAEVGGVLRETRTTFDHVAREPDLEVRWHRLGPWRQSALILLAVVALSLLVGGTVAAWLGLDWLFRHHGIR